MSQLVRDKIKIRCRTNDVDNCPAVPVTLGEAVYGVFQNDVGENTLPKKPADGAPGMTDLAYMVGFGGANSETAVWHFSTMPVHHFVVVPWYKHSTASWAYSVFMAFEQQYTLHEYVQNARGRMENPLSKGYRDEWSAGEIMQMLHDLTHDEDAWSDYFQHGTRQKVDSITCYKYKTISVEKALANLG